MSHVAILFYKLITAQLIKKRPALYDTESSLPCSQDFATRPVSNQMNTDHTLKSHSLHVYLLSSHPHLSVYPCICVSVSLQVFQHKFCMNFSPPMRATCLTFFAVLLNHFTSLLGRDGGKMRRELENINFHNH